MELILYTADCTGIPSNCVYPHEVVVDSKEKMVEAIEKDHVCAKYRNNYRSNENFMEANGFFMDNDNDHTDNPAEFITAEKLSEMLADVDHVIVPSRHNMLPKGSKPAKPRQHIYFPCQPYKDSTMYAAVKRAIQKKFPFLDDNAMDAARFFFGSSCDADDIIWNEGFLQIDETLDEDDYIEEAVEKEEYQTGGGVIHEGSRNNTLSLFAGKVLKKFGITDKAHDLFLERAAKCDPPLDDRELKTIWNSAVGFAKKIQSQEGYVPPEEFNAEFDAGLKPEDYSDIGEAKVLAKEYGSELKYTTATDYLRFDGECWREDRQMALGAAEDFLDLQLADAKEQVEIAEQALLGAGVSEENVKSGGKQLEKAVPDNSMGLLFALMGAQTYLKFVLRYRNYKNIVNFQNAAKPMLAIDVSELDKDPNLLNTPYATFDLEKGMAGELPHNPEDLITKITNCSPGDKGEQIWSDALDTFFCSDKELIEYVQMTVGMAAIGKVYQEHMIIAYGGGANGKSTFWNTIFRVLGSYAGKISAEALTMGCKRNVKPEMAELKGKRLIIASEMEEGVRLNTATVKQLCSTDEIQAEKKYKDPFHFVPSHTLVLYTNHLPRVGANDDGIWRRLIVIPFNAKITGKSDIKNYADYLYDQAGPAIMKWIIEGAKKSIDANFHTDLPKVVQAAIDRYREANDWLGQFIEDHCDVDPAFEEKSGDLYQQYRFACMQTGEYVRSTSDFYGALEKAGFRKQRRNSGRMIVGLKLKEGQDFLDS